jgi:hypothetical protein
MNIKYAVYRPTVWLLAAVPKSAGAGGVGRLQNLSAVRTCPRKGMPTKIIIA